jgi:hypothetical protein
MKFGYQVMMLEYDLDTFMEQMVRQMETFIASLLSSKKVLQEPELNIWPTIVTNDLK